MAKLEDVKAKINQLSGGEFQNLCDAYLTLSDYKGLAHISLGMKSGTNKTTIGIPDTYFTTSDGKYILVMYTTEKSLKKIREDIEDCFDYSKTRLHDTDILEIVHCHTFDMLRPDQDKELRLFCERHGVNLKLKGIDIIANDIYRKYPSLAKEYLGFSIDSGQIRGIDSFISEYDRNEMAAPLNLSFLLRDDELNDAKQKLEANSVLIIRGASGTGKTRLALEVCRKYVEDNYYRLFCIRSHNLEIYNDLNAFFTESGKYLLLVDDANELPGLTHVLELLKLRDEDTDFKIVITARDYAFQEVVTQVRQYTYPVDLEVKIFSDEDISKILETCLGITNPRYKERIARLAEGNVRLAILAGKLALKTQSIMSISDSSALYDSYFGSIGNNLLKQNKQLSVTAGIIAFFQVINLEYLDKLGDVFVATHISETLFRDCISSLYHNEFVDVYNDKVIKISDQCFGNYLVKHVFIDEEYCPLSLMLEVGYDYNKSRVIQTFSMILSVFSSEEIYKKVIKAVNIVWDKWKDIDPEKFEWLLTHFFTLRPTESLLLMKERIDATQTEHCDVLSIDFEKEQNIQQQESNILDILKGFSDREELPDALDLIFMYYQKRPDLCVKAYQTIGNSFGVNEKSAICGYYTQIKVVEKLIDIIRQFPTLNNQALFVRIASRFLKFYFAPLGNSRKPLTVLFYQIYLSFSENVMDYRLPLMKELNALYAIPNLRDSIEEILYFYGSDVNKELNGRIVQTEYPYLLNFFQDKLSPKNLKHCVLARHINYVGELVGINQEQRELLLPYLEAEKFKLYEIINESSYRDKPRLHRKDRQELRKAELISLLIEHNKIEKFEEILEIIKEAIVSLPTQGEYSFRTTLSFLFEEFSKEPTNLFGTIGLYLEHNTPAEMSPMSVMGRLFEFESPEAIWKLIHSSDYSSIRDWEFVFFSELPETRITDVWLQNLKTYFSSTDKEFPKFFRPLFFLDKYKTHEQEIWITVCKQLLISNGDKPSVLSIYFESFFNQFDSNEKEMIKHFNGEFGLIESIYLQQIHYDRNCDNDGHFLMALLDVDERFLFRYLDDLIGDKDKLLINEYEWWERLHPVWLHKDFLSLISSIVEYSSTKLEWGLYRVISGLLESRQDELKCEDRKRQWIVSTISIKRRDKQFIGELFEAISEQNEGLRRDSLFSLLDFSEDYDLFVSISLIPSSYTWSGSQVPVLQNQIAFLRSLFPKLIGLRYIRHRQYVGQKIRRIEERIEKVKFEEFIEEW